MTVRWAQWLVDRDSGAATYIAAQPPLAGKALVDAQDIYRRSRYGRPIPKPADPQKALPL